MFKSFSTLFLLFVISNSYANELTITTSSDAEIPVTSFAASDKSKVLLWLPTEYGIRGREDATAEAIAKNNVNVWIADLHATYFIPRGRSSYNNIDNNDIIDLIKAASLEQTREVIIFATGRAAPIAMQAVRQLQLKQQTANIVKSAILFHPNFYTNSTDVGNAINYLPITYATNLAIYIGQPELSGKKYQLKTLSRHLQQGGSDVISKFIKNVADGFNIRTPDNEAEEQAYQQTPAIILNAVKLLEHFKKPRSAANLPEKQPSKKSAKLDTGLQKYNGNIKELYLDYFDRKKRKHTLSTHKGKVLLLNFWASWCPPCVKELPSLTRLRNKINSKHFEILAINIGEDSKTVTEFLKPMDIAFPVLFDPDGNSVTPWNLVAFPSSFVIDKKGVIRYGLFGGLEWDNEEVQKIIRSLLTE